MEHVIEVASGAYFSGWRPDGIIGPSTTSSCSLPQSSPSGSSTAPKQPFVIGVSGGTASGKTTVCDLIIQQLQDHRVVLVSQDSFYRGLTDDGMKHVHEYNFDHPDAFDTEQLVECITKLKSGDSVQVPIYDFKHHHRRCSDNFRQVVFSHVKLNWGVSVGYSQTYSVV